MKIPIERIKIDTIHSKKGDINIYPPMLEDAEEIMNLNNDMVPWDYIFDHLYCPDIEVAQNKIRNYYKKAPRGSFNIVGYSNANLIFNASIKIQIIRSGTFRGKKYGRVGIMIKALLKNSGLRHVA
jgi:hypothetical protein